MSNNVIELPLIRFLSNKWIPFISLGITLYGILVLGWRIEPIVFFFWWEVILMLSTALIRMLFAMGGKPFIIYLFLKISLLAGGLFMGAVLIMLSVAFTMRSFGDFDGESFKGIYIQVRLLMISYAIGLILYYFMNGRYKTANPTVEIVSVFFHLVFLLAILMIFTMFIIPRFPQLNQALWATIALVVVKFVVDFLVAHIRGSFLPLIEKPALLPQHE